MPSKKDTGGIYQALPTSEKTMENHTLSYKSPFTYADLKKSDGYSSFVDIEDLVRSEREIIKTMKDHTDMKIVTSQHNEKYSHDLFYLAPLYHKKFSRLERLVVLDIDLGILTSIQDLYSQFDQFGSGDQCIGLAPDLSPHYWHKLESFRADNPDTSLGQPGDRQGFNTGVALYHLHCLRQSPVFTDYTTPSEVKTGNRAS